VGPGVHGIDKTRVAIDRLSIRKLATCIVDALLMVAILIIPFIWILRDGLGPNARESTGVIALGKAFLTFYWGPVTLLLILGSFVGHASCRTRGSSPGDARSKG
jgi:hypothetical protein